MGIKFEVLSKDNFSSIKKVDSDSAEFIKSFHSYNRLKYPVFFHSVAEMICMDHFYYVVINDCLVVFRVNRMYGNNSCIVYFSPISRNNDVEEERNIFASLLRAGFSVRLTSCEVARLGVNLKAVKAYKPAFNNEFIYSINDSLEMEGSKYSSVRYKVNRFLRGGGLAVGIYPPNVSDFILAWSKLKGINYSKFIRFLDNSNNGNLFYTTLYFDGEIQGFAAVEEVGKFYHSVVIVPNHDAPFDMAPALHYCSMIALPNKDTYMTTGAGGEAGLDAQKRRLHPEFEETVYRIPAIGSVRNSYELVKDFL